MEADFGAFSASRKSRSSSARNNKSKPHKSSLTPAGIDPHSFMTKSLLRSPLTTGLVTLDGRTLEGGGQLVRVALTLSALLRIPLRIHDIRGGRGSREGSGGGLKESHLAALEFLEAALGRGRGVTVFGGEVGGKEVLFLPVREVEETERGPGHGSGSHQTISLKNPGSVWLIFQALYPFLVFRGGIRNSDDRDASSEPIILTMRGGTNVSKSMSAEYVQQVFLPVAEKIGLPRCEIAVKKRGWTHGSRIEIGEVEIKIWQLPVGGTLAGFGEGYVYKEGNEKRESVTKISISVLASPVAVLERLIEATQARVKKHFPNVSEMEVVVQEDSGDPRRMYLLLVGHLDTGWKMGRDWLYDEKMKKNDLLGSGMDAADRMAQRVAADLAKEVDSDGVVDEFMQDQLVVFQALAAGKSVVKAGEGREEGTEHTKTVRWVIQEMLKDKIEINDSSVVGYGLVAGGEHSTGVGGWSRENVPPKDVDLEKEDVQNENDETDDLDIRNNGGDDI